MEYKIKKYIEVPIKLKNFYLDMIKEFNDNIGDFLGYDYAEDCFYESWEDLLAMNLSLEIKSLKEEISDDTILEDYCLIPIELYLIENKVGYDAPNKELRDRIIKLFNIDFEKEFNKFISEEVFDNVCYYDKDKNRL